MRPQPNAACRSTYVVRTRFCDTDLMGIVHHAKYLEYFEAGRVEYMHRRGVEYLEWTQRGIHLPVVDVAVRYRKSVRFDERLLRGSHKYRSVSTIPSSDTDVQTMGVRFMYLMK